MAVRDGSSDVCSSVLRLPRGDALVPLDALDPRRVAPTLRRVRLVLAVRRETQSEPAVVGFIQIPMVNLYRWPFAGHVEPRKAMGLLVAAVDANPPVALRLQPPGPPQIGRAHVRTPVTNEHRVCRHLLEKKTHDHVDTQLHAPTIHKLTYDLCLY